MNIKSETNFVIDEALVLYGLDAPADINTEIVVGDLVEKFTLLSQVGQTE